MEVYAGSYKRLRIVNENEANFEKMFWQVKKPNERRTVMLKSLVNRKAAKEEFEIMRQLDHPNIVKVFESVEFSFQQCSYFGIAMEFMNLGDLRSFINMKNEQPPDERIWNEKDALVLVVQVLNGLRYLHQNEIIHRDLKPSNIFLGENNRLAIGDFGISDKLATTRMTKIIGTDDFLPPEAISSREEAENLTYARDMWSCGIVLYMIAYLKHPFVTKKRIRTMTQYKFPKCDDLISLCLKKNVDDRVANACLLAQDEYIGSLLYQLDSGISFVDMIFSGNFVEVVRLVNIKLEKDKKTLEEKNNSLQTKVKNLASDIRVKEFDLKNKEVSWKIQKSMYEENLQRMNRENESKKLENSINKDDILNDFNAKREQQSLLKLMDKIVLVATKENV
ncbi:unnamed protein product [Oikopleura dioica]|uniref:non-specific serine/threonine protein kinase n=1 Tax=Oikopleura dioica TaxID=34765 RepID=E4Y648_OIKDI|nr:unnamed protein product [Oikopleura dioica]